jgi:hypothetical protein
MINKDLVCFNCKHLNKQVGESGCKAFPKNLVSDKFTTFKAGLGLIPIDVIIETKHNEVINGQIGDFIFEPIS